MSGGLGWYVHHHGRGHLHRASAVAQVLDEPVTGLSSLPRPEHWVGDWVRLARDDDRPAPQEVVGDATAGGRLHWAPRNHDGLSRRMQQVSSWIDRARPRAVVVDVSVEVTLLARLHGVPVVGVVLPGQRADAAHRLGLEVSDVLVGCWPQRVTPTMLPGLPEDVRRRVRGIGALSRHPVAGTGGPAGPAPDRRTGDGPTVTFLAGTGGQDLRADALDDLLDCARSASPGWRWEVAGPGHWREDVAGLLRRSHVVVTHAGQNALAEVAAARRPAVVVPQTRPHEEQRTTALTLASDGWPATVLPALPHHGWAGLLEATARLDGDAWRDWCDGHAAERLAAILRDLA